MPLTAIVTIVIRILALNWFVDGVVGCIRAIITDHQRFGITPTPFSVYGIWVTWMVLALIVFGLSQPIARLVVPPPNAPINPGTLTRHDLYCFAFTFLGLSFFLSSFGDTINALHNYFVTTQAIHESASERSDAFYRLSRPALTLLAGLASLLLAPKFAQKLASVHLPSVTPPSDAGS